MPTVPTENLNIPRLDEGESGIIRHNEGLNILDALLHLAIIDRNLTAPPGSPANGARYLVAVGGTGAWAGKDGLIAAYYDGWIFMTPKEGWRMWVNDENVFLLFDGSVWIEIAMV